MSDLIYGTPEDGVVYSGEPSSTMLVLKNSPLMEDFCSEDELRVWLDKQATQLNGRETA